MNAWGPTDLARQVGSGNASYWSELLRGNRSFGEKAARKIEHALRLEEGALDRIEQGEKDESVLSPRASRIGQRFDAIPEGPFKEAVFVILQRILEDQ